MPPYKRPDRDGPVAGDQLRAEASAGVLKYAPLAQIPPADSRPVLVVNIINDNSTEYNRKNLLILLFSFTLTNQLASIYVQQKSKPPCFYLQDTLP